jgi:hypothetical protein
VERQPDLFQIVDALGAPGGLARGLDRGQEQSNEHSDDRDDNEKLDQSETAASHDSPPG